MKVVSSSGTLILSAGMVLNIAALTYVLETGYSSVSSLAKPLRYQLLADGPHRRMIKNMIREIEDIKPLSANGYFSISRGVLTSMVSVGITYIIILVQFKISAS